MAEGRGIDETKPLRIDFLFLGIIIITLLFEKLTHFLDHSLKGRTRRGLRHAVHYIEEELLALGLISLLLIVSEEYLLEICVSSDSSSKEKTYDTYDDGHRRLLAGDEEASTCPEGKEPYWSAQTIHQTHILIFLVAVVHVLYATVSILICLWRMRRWRIYENQPDHALKRLGNTKLMYGRNRFEYWFWSFWAQFSPSMDESLYLSMRCLFIERMEFPHDFDFLGFVVNTLVEEFAIVVRTDWVMWVVAAVWIFVPEFLLATTAAAVLIVLVAGTKLELIGVKLSQMAYLSYGDRTHVNVKEILAPNTIIRKSVMNVAQKLTKLSAKSDEEKGPKLATLSLSVQDRKRNKMNSDDAVIRRIHSFESGRMVSFAFHNDKKVIDMVAAEEISPTNESQEPTPIVVETKMDKKENGEKENHSLLRLKLPKRPHLRGTQFSEKYSLPDSAKLFWFQRPQLILRALRFVYFETAMAIAVVLFDLWQNSNFIIEDISGLNSKYIPISILITVGVLCLLHTSCLMLPTYALTMVAGSHCPEGVLRIAKKMKIDTDKVTSIENLQGMSLMVDTDQFDAKSKRNDHSHHNEGPEKTISSLVGAMYRGKLQRWMQQSELDTSVRGSLDGHSRMDLEEIRPNSNEISNGQEAQASSSSPSEDEEMRRISKIFGSFEKFLESLKFAQAAVRQLTPNAYFSFDCLTGSYHGRESTPYDTAAINLTWDLIAAAQNIQERQLNGF